MQQQQQGPQVDITATTEVLCECGNNTFKEVMYIRKESRLMSGLPEDRIVPLQLIACDKCGILVENFIPSPLKQFYGKDAIQSF
jgi:exonuclease I